MSPINASCMQRCVDVYVGAECDTSGISIGLDESQSSQLRGGGGWSEFLLASGPFHDPQAPISPAHHTDAGLVPVT